MRILVTGGNGFIGGHIVRALAARGHQVVACGRSVDKVAPAPGVTPLFCDYSTDQTPERWLPRLRGIDVVINAVGIIREQGRQTFEALHQRAPVALFQACGESGVGRVIQISALGADAGAQSRYHLTKRAADDALASSGIPWVILRPSLVYGPGGASAALFQAVAALPVVPLIGQGDQPVRPLHVDDLVRAVILAVEHDSALGKRIDLVGRQEIAFGDYLRGWRTWLELGPMRAFNVPYRVALRGAKLAGFLGSQPVDTETVQMLQRGNTAPVEPFVEVFGFVPSAPEEWWRASPPTPGDRCYAQLFLLRPLLRWSIGFVWIWAGLTSAWLYPPEASYELLAAVGISGNAAPLALYGAALLDVALGVATWFRWRLRRVARIQIAVILGYTAILSLWLPAWWLHPFGPVAKNLPLLVATLIMLALEDRKS